jgi:spore germination protein KA
MFSWKMFRSPGAGGHANSPRKLPLYPQLTENVNQIKSQLGNSPDLTIRQFEVGSSRTQVAVVYTDGLVDTDVVNEFILQSLMVGIDDETFDRMAKEKGIFNVIQSNALTVGQVGVVRDWNTVLLSVLGGDSIIFVEGQTEAMVCGTRGGDRRGVTEPSSQVVIRGPKEAFTESIGTNVALIRRRVKSIHLWLETMKIGQEGKTDVAVMYIKGVASDELVQEVKKRLGDIKVDAVSGSGQIEQLIQDETATLFPTMYTSERPDSVAGNLLEGRVAIIVDGTPFVLVAPATFFMFLQSTEDYYQRPEIATAIRFLRYAAMLVSLFGPSIYIAAITFHQEMIPTQLVVSLAAQRESVLFPALIEALIMEFAFEILREAGIRMPRAIGQAVSIVGALVLGQAAVEAGLISSAMVIVVALTGISSFSTPSYDMALTFRLLRFAIMISAGFLGFYGISIVSIFILAHMCGLRSFGIPYMTPFAPFILEDQKDTLFRFPYRALVTRPRLIAQKDMQRQDEPDQPSNQPGP